MQGRQCVSLRHAVKKQVLVEALHFNDAIDKLSWSVKDKASGLTRNPA
jgi:hypothetical protein